jgi:hypothetical protein
LKNLNWFEDLLYFITQVIPGELDIFFPDNNKA